MGFIGFHGLYNGRYEDRLEILLEDERLRQRFVIVRPVRAIIGSKEDHELLKPKAPFVPRERIVREPETEILKGVFPLALKAVPYVVPLLHADIPKHLSSSLSKGSTADVISSIRRIFLPKVWDSSTYGQHFKTLLWIEEHRMEFVFLFDLSVTLAHLQINRRDLEMYDISYTTLTTHNQYY